MNNSLREIAEKLINSDRIMITGHEHPDGDSIGSILALGLALRKLGKEVDVLDWGVPGKFSFLPDHGLLKPLSEHWRPDVLVFLDCSDEGRVPKDIEKIYRNVPLVINIDHHISNKFFGDLNYVDALAAATGEIIYELLKELKVGIDKDLSLCLYTAIATDTGSFRYSNTTQKTHLIVAELIPNDLDIGNINTLLFEEIPLDAFRLLQEALTTFEISKDGRIAWIILPKATLERFGTNGENIESLINYTRMIKGVEIGLLFKETEEGMVNVGFRSKGTIDVNNLAQVFGGGGHAKASGCKIKGTVNKAKEMVLKEAQKLL